MELREGWQARVEALSFALLRRCEVREQSLEAAMLMTSTNDRLLMCVEQLSLKRAMLLAQLSVENALGQSDSDDARSNGNAS
jgi:hypothetical protein